MEAPSRTVLFVAGAEPAAGKTVVAAALVRRLAVLGKPVVAVKPIETGCAHGDDQDLLARDGLLLHAAVLRSMPPLVVSPYRFAAGVEPAVAAEHAGLSLSLTDALDAVHAAFRYGELAVVEGPGGALSPLVQDGLTVDLAEQLGATVLVVAADRAGAQSQVLAVLEALRRRALRIGGVLLSVLEPSSEALENARLIRERGGVRVFPTVPYVAGDARARIEAVEAHLAAHGVAEQLLQVAAGP